MPFVEMRPPPILVVMMCPWLLGPCLAMEYLEREGTRALQRMGLVPDVRYGAQLTRAQHAEARAAIHSPRVAAKMEELGLTTRQGGKAA